jgi:hypothetical protein
VTGDGHQLPSLFKLSLFVDVSVIDDHHLSPKESSNSDGHQLH